MLFVDKITECVPMEYAKGFKLFSYNEWYFHGYETSSPKVWNVIQVEAMSQVFLMTFLSSEESKGKVAMSNKFNNVVVYNIHIIICFFVVVYIVHPIRQIIC